MTTVDIHRHASHKPLHAGDMESVLWGIEKDPLLRQTMTAVLILDRPPDRETLLDRLERASRTLPPLRHRLVEVPFRLSTPRWLVDPNFDLSYHVRQHLHTTVPPCCRRTRRSRLQPPSPPACRDYLFAKRANGVNPWCPSGVSVNTCSRRRAPSGIRSLPAWAFPSSRPSSRTGGRPRPSSWSLPRCAFPSCCNGGGGSRLQPIAMKQHCSTQPSTRWTQPSMSSSSEMIPAAQLIEPPITHPRTRSIPTVLVRAPAI